MKDYIYIIHIIDKYTKLGYSHSYSSRKIAELYIKGKIKEMNEYQIIQIEKKKINDLI